MLIYLIKGKLSWEVLKTKSKERKSGKNKLKNFYIILREDLLT